jgi:hypothetical protein
MWVLMGVIVIGPFHSLEFGQPLPDTPLGQAIGDGVLVWAEFAGRALPLAFVAALTLGGTAIRSLNSGTDLSPSYTLTLPVSRTRLVWTRLTTALIATALLAVLVSALAGLVLLSLGVDVPLVPVAQSVALGVVVALVLCGILGLLLTFLPFVWAALASLLVFMLAVVPISYLVSSPARSDMPWGLLTAGLAVTLLSGMGTASRASTQEYR